MTDLESEKNWIISRWITSVGEKTYKIKPEIRNDVSMSYRAGYLAAISDFKEFLASIGVYSK